MKRNFVMLLAAGAMLLSPSIWAKEPGQGKLDLVLKCESDDGKSFSEIVNLTNESFGIWDAGKGMFREVACNYESRIANDHPGEQAGFKASCEASPVVLGYQQLYFLHGCGTRMVESWLDRGLPYEKVKHLECPIEKIVESFRVDRRDGRFRWITGSGGPDGAINKDVQGSCTPAKRPKAPATKF